MVASWSDYIQQQLAWVLYTQPDVSLSHMLFFACWLLITLSGKLKIGPREQGVGR